MYAQSHTLTSVLSSLVLFIWSPDDLLLNEKKTRLYFYRLKLKDYLFELTLI